VFKNDSVTFKKSDGGDNSHRSSEKEKKPALEGNPGKAAGVAFLKELLNDLVDEKSVEPVRNENRNRSRKKRQAPSGETGATGSRRTDRQDKDISKNNNSKKSNNYFSVFEKCLDLVNSCFKSMSMATVPTSVSNCCIGCKTAPEIEQNYTRPSRGRPRAAERYAEPSGVYSRGKGYNPSTHRERSESVLPRKVFTEREPNPHRPDTIGQWTKVCSIRTVEWDREDIFVVVDKPNRHRKSWDIPKSWKVEKKDQLPLWNPEKVPKKERSKEITPETSTSPVKLETTPAVKEEFGGSAQARAMSPTLLPSEPQREVRQDNEIRKTSEQQPGADAPDCCPSTGDTPGPWSIPYTVWELVSFPPVPECDNPGRKQVKLAKDTRVPALMPPPKAALPLEADGPWSINYVVWVVVRFPIPPECENVGVKKLKLVLDPYHEETAMVLYIPPTPVEDTTMVVCTQDVSSELEIVLWDNPQDESFSISEHQVEDSTMELFSLDAEYSMERITGVNPFEPILDDFVVPGEHTTMVILPWDEESDLKAALWQNVQGVLRTDTADFSNRICGAKRVAINATLRTAISQILRERETSITLAEMNALLYVMYVKAGSEKKAIQGFKKDCADKWNKKLDLLTALRCRKVEPEKARRLKKQFKVSTPAEISSEINKVKDILAKKKKLQKAIRFKKLSKFLNTEAEWFSRYKKTRRQNLEFVEIEDKTEHEQFWKNIWEIPQDVNVQNLEEAIEKCRFTTHDSLLTSCPISLIEVERALAHTSPWKACGPDGVYPHLYKTLSVMTTRILVRLFNDIWLGRTRPEQWFATGRTILFYKMSGEKTSPKNYRPITMLNTCYKLFTSVLEGRIIQTLIRTGNWDPEQRALLNRRRGCLDAHLMNEFVVNTCRTITHAPLNSAYIDFCKAYDSVSHIALIRMLEVTTQSSTNKPNRLVAILKTLMPLWCTYITNIKGDAVRINIKRGIFQGDKMSPTLFCVALTVLRANQDNAMNISTLVDRVSVDKICYMDDIKLFDSSLQRLGRKVS
jgi:hypothetical protein